MISKLSKKQALIVALVLTFALAPAARAGVADILTLLNTITSTIRNGIGVALNGIQTIQNAERQLQQQVLWPVTVINQTKASVSQVRAQFTGLAQQVHSLATNSATLANPKQLELLLRGQRTSNLGHWPLRCRRFSCLCDVLLLGRGRHLGDSVRTAYERGSAICERILPRV